MKTIIKILPVLLLVLFVSSSFHVQKNDDPVKIEKKAQIKMIKDIDGVVTEIDTVLTDFAPADIEKMSKKFMGCHSGKLGLDSLKKSHMFYQDEKGKRCHIYKFISSDGLSDMSDIDVSAICEGDSVMRKVIIIKDPEGNDRKKKVMILRGDPDETEMLHGFPPDNVPKMIMKHKMDGNIIRLDDPSIISFKKKDIDGNKEKIEIIREKPVKQ